MSLTELESTIDRLITQPPTQPDQRSTFERLIYSEHVRCLQCGHEQALPLDYAFSCHACGWQVCEAML